LENTELKQKVELLLNEGNKKNEYRVPRQCDGIGKDLPSKSVSRVKISQLNLMEPQKVKPLPDPTSEIFMENEFLIIKPKDIGAFATELNQLLSEMNNKVST
jgi:hypothetical protein